MRTSSALRAVLFAVLALTPMQLFAGAPTNVGRDAKGRFTKLPPAKAKPARDPKTGRFISNKLTMSEHVEQGMTLPEHVVSDPGHSQEHIVSDPGHESLSASIKMETAPEHAAAPEHFAMPEHAEMEHHAEHEQRGWLARNFTIRSEAKDVLAMSNAQRKNGQLAASADTLIETSVKPAGLREQFAFWRAAAKLNKTSAKEMKERSAKGDAFSTTDALTASSMMKDAGKMSWLGRWRASRAATGGFGLRFGLKFWRVNGALQNSLKVASKQARKGNLDVAKENLELATSLAKPGSRQIRMMERAYFRNAMYKAKRGAYHGNVEETMDGLKAASEAPNMQGMFDQGRAEAYVARAYRNSVPALIDEAAKVYASNRSPNEGVSPSDYAAYLLARSIDTQETQGIKPGFFAARKQASLMTKLGAKVAYVRERQAAAAAEQAEVAMHDPEVAAAMEAEQHEQPANENEQAAVAVE